MKIIIFIFVLISVLPQTAYSESKWNIIYKSPYTLTNNFSDIDCRDSNNCIALMNMNLVWPWIIKTSDGGHSWDTVLTNTGSYLPRMERCVYVSDKFCIATAEWGNYWISRDDGLTWEHNKIETENGYNLMRADFLNEEVGVMQTFIEVYITKDSARTWFRKKMPVNDGNEILSVGFDIQVINSNMIYLLVLEKLDSRIYYLYHSSDFGNTWNKKYICDSETSILNRMYFLDEMTGWVAGSKYISQYKYKDIILKTTDSGETWIEQLDTLKSGGNNTLGLKNIQFYDENFGIAWGEWWRLWMTLDGGKTWHYDRVIADQITPMYPSDYCIVHPDCIYGVTVGRWIIKYSEELVSVPEPETQKEDFLIYPNPASRGENINFSFSLPSEGKAEIEIFDSFGKKAASYRAYFKSGKNTLQLQPDGSFSTGAYYTVIKSRGKILHREMFVVM